MPILSTRIHDAMSDRLAKLSSSLRKPVSSVTKEAIDIGLMQLENRERADQPHTLAALCHAMALGTEPPYWAWPTVANLVYEAFQRAPCEVVTAGTVRTLGRFLLAGYGALPAEDERRFSEPEILSTLNAVDAYNMGRNADVPRAIEALLHTPGAFVPTFVARAIAECLPSIFNEDQFRSAAPVLNAGALQLFQDIYPMAVYGLRLSAPPSEINDVLPCKNELFEPHAIVAPISARCGDVEITAVGWHVPFIECYAWLLTPMRARVSVADPFALCGCIERALDPAGVHGGRAACGGGLSLTKAGVTGDASVGIAVEGMLLELDEQSLRQLHGATCELLHSKAFIANFQHWRTYAGSLMVPWVRGNRIQGGDDDR